MSNREREDTGKCSIFCQLISKVALGQAEYCALFRAELRRPSRNGPSVKADQNASEWDRFKMWTTLSRDVTETQV